MEDREGRGKGKIEWPLRTVSSPFHGVPVAWMFLTTYASYNSDLVDWRTKTSACSRVILVSATKVRVRPRHWHRTGVDGPSLEV